MNPIFIAHLAADFLFQPTWLAKLKAESFWGVLVHALVHAIIFSAVFLPININSALIITALIASHGLVDFLKGKIQSKSKKFEPLFLLDQFVHLLLLALASQFLMPSAFWYSVTGLIILVGCWILSAAAAFIHLEKLEHFPMTKPAQSWARFGAITIVFVIFGLSGFLS